MNYTSKKIINLNNPIINLWSAVIKIAVEDLHCKDRSLQYYARQWFKCNDTEFPAFIALCEMLDLNYETIRVILNLS